MTSGIERSLPGQLDRMARAEAVRRSRATLRDTHITLSHGSGGKASHTLFEAVIAPVFTDPLLETRDDSAVFSLHQNGGMHSAAGVQLAFTTDSYVVSPLFFPGGDIGKLAVNGTINDLAVAGATPRFLSVGLIIEEGLEIDVLRQVVMSMAAAAEAAGVRIVTGDTKVVHRGKADLLFVNTSGVGVVRDGCTLSPESARPGDRVLVNGFIGDHGMAVMLAREALEMEAEIESDCAPLHTLAAALLEAAPGTRVLRDPTRGGVATTLNEIALQSGVCVTIDEESVPVRAAVRGACEMLGIDPLHIANEGKLLAIVPEAESDAALATLRGHALGRDAAVIGQIIAAPEGMVVLRTTIGGSRVLDMLVGDPLPRIC
ncbi:MAG: hydrogenase expression/formation protein HypE [Gemmatimonadaceae bacterium]